LRPGGGPGDGHRGDHGSLVVLLLLLLIVVGAADHDDHIVDGFDLADVLDNVGLDHLVGCGLVGVAVRHGGGLIVGVRSANGHG
jgi:hypothetical protein